MISEDGNFSIANPTGSPKINYPLRQHPEHFTVVRRMYIRSEYYDGPPLNDPDHFYPDAFCVGDGSHRENGPLLEFERTWATVPQAKDFAGAANVTFPAFGSTTTTTYNLSEEKGVAVQQFVDFIPRESPLTLRVPTRIRDEYFLPGVVGANSLEEIPILPAFRVVNNNGQELTDLSGANATPSVATYQSWIKSGIEIVATGTRITNYWGNIWRARTVYTKAR